MQWLLLANPKNLHKRVLFLFSPYCHVFFFFFIALLFSCLATLAPCSHALLFSHLAYSRTLLALAPCCPIAVALPSHVVALPLRIVALPLCLVAIPSHVAILPLHVTTLPSRIVDLPCWLMGLATLPLHLVALPIWLCGTLFQ